MITLRKATINDLETLLHWDNQQHVIDADPDDDWNWEYELKREPEWREQLMAEHQNRPIGFIQIIDPAKEESHYWGEIAPNKRAIDIWIGEKADLGKGYGTQMMRLALEKCFENKDIIEVLIDPLASNKRAIKFYKKLGFTFLEERTFDTSHCEVYTIKREDWLKLGS